MLRGNSCPWARNVYLYLYTFIFLYVTDHSFRKYANFTGYSRARAYQEVIHVNIFGKFRVCIKWKIPLVFKRNDHRCQDLRQSLQVPRIAICVGTPYSQHIFHMNT